MAEITKYRSSSLSSLNRDENESRLRGSSDVKDVDSRRTQSSDSLLSLSQSTCIDPDTLSQISLPEWNGTVVDSEGYSSFRSNLSCSSSPFSSNHTSPTGEGDLLVDSLDENSIGKHGEGACKSISFVNDGEGQDNVDKQAKLMRSKEVSLFEDVVYGKNPMLGPEDRKHYSLDHSGENIETGRDSDSINLSGEHGVNDSKPVLGPLLLEKRMSTIEECYEETPSPRSIVDIDKSFIYAYKRNVLQKSSIPGGCELQGNEEKWATGWPSKEADKHDELKVNYDDANVQSCDGDGLDRPSGIFAAASRVMEVTDADLLALKVKERKDFEPCEVFPNSASDDGVTKPCFDVSGREFAAKDGQEVHDLSILSEQAFDIDLDLYEIPHQRRQSLELKLNDLRKFVDRIIADRKCLENDRLYLQQTLHLIEQQRLCSNGFYSMNTNDLPEGIGEKEANNEERFKNCAESSNFDRAGTDSTAHVPKLDDVISNEHVSNKQTDEMPSTKTDFDELLSSLEDALLENIELKHMNKDLVNVNEELRQRIEELLTDEEELRYKLNESTLKLMEDAERQREENIVLRSNFNKVLRDYNSLETEFKELEQSYEELILERDLLVDELSIKNEDYQLCKEECIRLADELEEAREELESVRREEEKVWTRADWEQWTVLQTKISATEVALFDARKQKAQLVADLKRMKKILEAGKEKIEDAEKAMGELEKNLKKAQKKNESLQNENAELRYSILEYEAKLVEFGKLAEEKILEVGSQNVERCVDCVRQEHEVAGCKIDDWVEIPSDDFENYKSGDENESNKDEDCKKKNLTVLRKCSNIRRARTFPFNDLETLALRMFQDTSPPADTYADSQYQSAFQEVGVNCNEEGDENEEPLMMKASSATACSSANTFAMQSDVIDDGEDNVKKRNTHRYTCFSLKTLLPSVLQGMLNARAKKGRHCKSPNKRRDKHSDV